ncbi:hypothetical protein [Lactovum odontotermitis]
MLNFEIKKFFLSKKNLVILVMLGLLLVVTHFVRLNSSLNTGPYKLEKIGGIKYGISKAEEKLQDSSYPEDLRVETEERVKDYKRQVKALESNQFNSYFEIQNKLNHQYLKYDEKDKQLEEQKKFHQHQIDYYNLIKKRRLDFELEPGSQVHAFGTFINTPLVSMFTSMYLLIFAVLISVQISTHFESKEFLFYDFAKISRQRTLFQKVSAALLVTFASILLISAVDIISVGIKNGFGSLNYPGYLKNFKGAGSPMVPWRVDNMAIPNGQIILISLSYLFLILIFLSALGALFSVLFKKSLVVVGIIAVFIVGWSLIEQKDYMQAVRRFVPMSYLDPRELLCHPAYLFGKSSLVVGIVYLAALSAICFLFSSFLMKKYRVRRL